MLENHANLPQIFLSEASGDEDLDTHSETHCQRGEHIVEQACHHRGTQLNGAQMPQKGRIGEGDDGLCQHAQHDGIGDAPDFAVGDRGFQHDAKIRKNS